MKRWNDIKAEFDIDGSLRDIYVENISEELWNKFIDAIKSSDFRYDFTHSDALISLPGNFQDIKALQEDNPTTLVIWLNDKISVFCHFFIISEIELDISPEHINDEMDYQTLLSFMTWLASLLGQIVSLTHENAQDMEILNVS
ncbi:hypothetical protein CJF42_25110 [Pseudoalteromonas sp. NBT06-2]|uniref:protein export chaperone SecB n=1 Tax=Pseudoalteromonas sp. NBT06-2 TaxID=2025950 RepID=UPI000BA72A9B|nr:protein export chaperone SecB [Pseudoalteromonas sp. NBT06-2]PAJ71734.1 hypothetical protein CJF42_25110 [Pseudoalteromonas sp. NBT06-2]